MSHINTFIDEYKKLQADTLSVESELSKKIKKISALILQIETHSSNELQDALKKLQVRTEEPMKVAITGQFSSGKSTFLNALLSKSILPTGITPVTSKVNYIRYGEDFRIKAHYTDGREEFHNLESIGKFTDQRESVTDIEYLTIYAPLELLRDIIFVDTPGLNSQSNQDTSTTQKVLREVDGIIWLTLIDNAGKESELEILKTFMPNYQDKSLCVLNQKDKFNQEQIAQTLAYSKEVFGDFFSCIVPISAIWALKARSQDKKHQIEILLDDFIHKLKEISNTPSKITKNGFLQEAAAHFEKKASFIYTSDSKENQILLEKSNIGEVLEFIDKNIRPKSDQAQKFAIQKDINSICKSLQNEHKYFIEIYEELSEILMDFEAYSLKELEKLKQKFAEDLVNSYKKIEQIIQKIAVEIFNNITYGERVRYEKKEGFFLKNRAYFEAITYEATKIQTDAVYKKLFFDDDEIGKLFKEYVKTLRAIEDVVNEQNGIIYKKLESSLILWQKKYEIIRKKSPLHSDIEFANIRRFASKAYEEFLKSFSDEIHNSYAQISSNFHYLSSAVNFNYKNATGECISFLEHKIRSSIELHEQEPATFSLYRPKLEEIEIKLKENFYLYKFENMMHSNNTFLNKNYDWLKNRFATIKDEKIETITQYQKRHDKIIKRLEELEISLNKSV